MTGWNLPPGCTTRDIDEAMGTDEPVDLTGGLNAAGVTGWLGWWSESGDLLAARESVYDGTNHAVLGVCQWDDDLEGDANVARAVTVLVAAIKAQGDAP